MGTGKFNILDKVIAWMRLRKVTPFFKNGDQVLDFGCGKQVYLLKFIEKTISGGIGLDYDILTGKISDKISTIQFMFKEKLPFVDKRFDKVVMLAVLEHLPVNKVDLLFREFCRVLKENGKVILTTPTPFSKPILEFLAAKLKIISADEVFDHKHYYSQTDIQSLCSRNNLELISYNKFQLGMNSVVVIGKFPSSQL